jgi:hypothetical protein
VKPIFAEGRPKEDEPILPIGSMVTGMKLNALIVARQWIFTATIAALGLSLAAMEPDPSKPKGPTAKGADPDTIGEEVAVLARY